jgi:hypothetical protein
MNKRKYYILLILFFVFASSAAFAQKDKKVSSKKAIKKEISNARANIKRGNNLENAENAMRNLLKDSANIDNEKIWLTLFDAVKKQYEQLNEKLYLGQQSDTAKFFTNTLHMFDVLESLDSVNANSGKDEKSTPTFRKKHANYLHQYRTNLFGGGGYYLQKNDYANAYNFFKAYLDCAVQPLFSDFDYENTDKRMIDAAYWAVFCGYKLSRPDIVEKYSPIALKNPKTDVYMQQYIAESYMLKNDTANYRAVLEKGFEKYPNHAYFFPHLAVYYANNGMHKKVLEISERALALNPNNLSALLTRSSALLHEEKYDECVKVADKAISIDNTKAIAYLNAGLAYYNRTIPLTKKKKHTQQDNAEIITLYKRALPYLAKYRELMPDDKKIWALPLYNIYLNLNMGDEFEDIEKLLTK